MKKELPFKIITLGNTSSYVPNRKKFTARVKGDYRNPYNKSQGSFVKSQEDYKVVFFWERRHPACARQAGRPETCEPSTGGIPAFPGFFQNTLYFLSIVNNAIVLGGKFTLTGGLYFRLKRE